jgi:hypothetical protein
MSANTRIDEVFELGVKLPESERRQLIEKLVLSLGHEEEVTPASEPPPAEHWGKALNQLVDSLDMSDWEALEIDDPVAWVEQIRSEQEIARGLDWESTTA